MKTYLINGYNYFKLRDLAGILDFGLWWDGETRTIMIESDKGYVEE